MDSQAAVLVTPAQSQQEDEDEEMSSSSLFDRLLQGDTLRATDWDDLQAQAVRTC
jgi:hypothetical protein